MQLDPLSGQRGGAAAHAQGFQRGHRQQRVTLRRTSVCPAEATAPLSEPRMARWGLASTRVGKGLPHLQDHQPAPCQRRRQQQRCQQQRRAHLASHFPERVCARQYPAGSRAVVNEGAACLARKLQSPNWPPRATLQWWRLRYGGGRPVWTASYSTGRRCCSAWTVSCAALPPATAQLEYMCWPRSELQRGSRMGGL